MKRKKKPYYPKRKIKAEIFKALFHYWSVKILDRVYPIVKDSRMKTAMTMEWDEETRKVIIRYNPMYLRSWDFEDILSGVFHEIGHITQGNIPFETEDQQIYAEWDAETYSLKQIKKYYPKKLYDNLIRKFKPRLHDPKFKKKNPIHYQAYIEIKDYQK